MQTVGESTVLCAICAEDRVRVQAVCSHDDDSSSTDAIAELFANEFLN